ncbi:hypothetical protein IL38_23705 [Actinopolyspora erythraea]|uniref:DUF1508 domain-containing protein n=1 Tax=Actinopolyspora erythraea TaxID=414996 RepID=A0ABR4WY44_9ACTN|nr:hypothetical protein [Actinopolyspora erythraea]KGI79319.1 hypothetical protein IL38_23705 [Actinopolyspora erythraea]
MTVPTRYHVTARRIPEPPDSRGRPCRGHSPRGRELPGFELEASDADEALELAHRLLGDGTLGVTHTVATVHHHEEDEDASSTWHWVNGVVCEPTEYCWTYAENGVIRSGGAIARLDADEATAFDASGGRVVSVVRTQSGRWRLTGSDYTGLTTSDHRHRFDSPEEALRHAQRRMSSTTVLVEVESWI